MSCLFIMLLLLNAAKKKLSRGNPAENHEMHRLHDTFMCSTYPHDDVESLLTSIRRQSAHTPSPRAKKTFGLMINDIYDTSMVARALRYGQRKQKNLRRDERGVVVNERAPKKKKVSSSDLWRSIYIRGLTIRSKRYSFGRFSRWLFFSSVATI
mmetsp:Transcript_36977/g.110747  ORF Transcript_36977/g.110747 Transcript_36977/m.110747 type:complete len:154 (-) Transcript_36977:380-841(-)